MIFFNVPFFAVFHKSIFYFIHLEENKIFAIVNIYKSNVKLNYYYN